MKKNIKTIILIIIILIICLILFACTFLKLSVKTEEKRQENTNKIATQIKQTQTTEEKQIKLRETLDYYYKNNKEDEIESLKLKLDDDSKEIIKNYEAAKKEREKTNLNYETGRVLIAVANEDANKANSIAKEYRGTLENKIELGDRTLLVVNTSLEYTVKKASAKYETLDETIDAQPNYIYKSTEQEIKYKTIKEQAKETFGEISNDEFGTDIDDIWHLQATTGIGIRNTWNALDNITGKTKVKVAVIDTGVYKDHEDLQTALATSKSSIGSNGSGLVTIDNGYGNIVDYDITDNSNHGTHVSGIIAATSNNGLGVAGVGAGNSNNMIDLVVVDAQYDAVNSGFVTADLVAAINYVKNLNVKVINMSLGGKGTDAALQSAITAAYNDGITFVAAAGNESTSSYVNPSDFDECISVIALLSDNTKASYSNYGSYKDISAPGGAGNGDSNNYSILSTIPNTVSQGVTYKYRYMSGTSMAAPVVSGVIGMMYSVDPNMTPAEVKTFLYDTATDLGDTGKDNEFGYGKINPSAMLSAITAPTNEAPTITTTALNPTYTAGGKPYSYTLTATGYPTDFDWSISSGSLPTGLSLNSTTGVISGTPTVLGTYNFTVKATNSVGDDTQSLSLEIRGTAPTITTTSLDDAIINQTYSKTLEITGYPESFTWSRTSGSLPTGLSLNTSTGTISGTPTEYGTFNFTVSATNGVTPNASQEFTLIVKNQQSPTITTTSLLTGYRNENYSYVLTSTGYPTSFTWTKTGNLPNGLTFNSNGTITGTPTQIGTFAITVTASNGIDPSSSKTLTLKIIDRPVATPSGVRVYLNTYNSATVIWNSVPNAIYYRVYYRRAGSSTWYSLTTTSNSKRIYNMAQGYKYYFRVVANSSYVSSYSSSYTNTYIYSLKKPTLKLSKSGYRTIKVKWSNISGESGYQIYRKAAGGKWKKVKTRSYKYKTWYNKKRVRGKKYYYKVRAYKTVNGKKVYSKFSKTKSIRR